MEREPARGLEKYAAREVGDLSEHLPRVIAADRSANRVTSGKGLARALGRGVLFFFSRSTIGTAIGRSRGFAKRIRSATGRREDSNVERKGMRIA